METHLRRSLRLEYPPVKRRKEPDVVCPKVRRQGALAEFDRGDPVFGAAGEDITIDRDQALGVVGRLFSPDARGKGEEGKRPDDERPRHDARLEGFAVF